MKKQIFYMMFITLLSGCDCYRGDTLQIEEQGSSTVGDTVLTNSLGYKYHGDHAYVFYQKPVDAWKYPLVSTHGIGQFSKTQEITPGGCEGLQDILLHKGFSTYLVDQPRRGNAGRSTEVVTLEPIPGEEEWFNCFRVGIYLGYFEGIQFSRDRGALNQYSRQMTPTIGPLNFDIYSDTYVAFSDKIGLAIFATHSRGDPVDWFILLKTRNIEAIVAYEPGEGIPSPIGQVSEEDKVLTRSKETEGIEVPMAASKRYIEIPIITCYGDNLPGTDKYPELYERTRRPHLMRKWAEMFNKLGGDVTVIHLPDVGLHGNTHFPMLDLNNVEVAGLPSKWLCEKQLDRQKLAEGNPKIQIKVVMKLKCLLVMLSLTLLPRSNTPAVEDKVGSLPHSEPGETLVVYFSWSGRVQTVASITHGPIGCDMVEIESKEPYPDEYNEVIDRFKNEKDDHVPPALRTEIENMDDYDALIIGSPIWGGPLPSPIKNFLSGYDLSGKEILPFYTHGGGGTTRGMDNTRKLCPHVEILLFMAVKL